MNEDVANAVSRNPPTGPFLPGDLVAWGRKPGMTGPHAQAAKAKDMTDALEAKLKRAEDSAAAGESARTCPRDTRETSNDDVIDAFSMIQCMATAESDARASLAA